MLSEKELKAIETTKFALRTVHEATGFHQETVICLIDIIDRLLAEKEEYDKKFESVLEWVPDKHCPLCIHDENWNPVSLCSYHYEIHQLVAENEAIKVNMDAENKVYREMWQEAQAQLDAIKKAWRATMDKASDDVFDNLDRLIGGE